MEQHLRDYVSDNPDARSASTVFQDVENAYQASNDISLFSTSLPVIPHGKYGFPLEGESEDTLPGDDELFDFDLSYLPTQLEDLELDLDLDLEDDLFESGGGMEMDFYSQDGLRFGLSNLSMSDSVPLTGINRPELPNHGPAIVGEHPYGEHPSRTLFVRNINSNVEDFELKSLFEEFGEIRYLYTVCKHRGFVMISYYDIRHARAAMRELQNKPLRRRKLDIHFSIPKDHPSEKDINQGTLVVFNLDPLLSNDDVRHIFSAYGEVKDVRDTPHKRHHRFVEYYDVRAAEMALKILNGSEIAGKRVKIEHSRPGGVRKSMMKQVNLELDHDETRTFWHNVGSPVINSPVGSWSHLSSPVERSSQQGFSWSSGFGTLSPVNNPLPGLASIIPPHMSNPVKNAPRPIGKDTFIKSSQGFDYQQSQSFPDQSSQFDPSSIGRLSGPEFLWGSPQSSSSSRAPSVGQFAPTEHGQDYSSPSQYGTFLGSHHPHVGSAPSSERAFMSPNVFNGAGPIGNGSPISRIPAYPSMGLMFIDSGSYQGRGVLNNGLVDRNHSQRVDSVNQIGNKQYQLDLGKIICGEDTRTTLMIKNIPNKYTSKMLLAAIDETNKGAYDFVYLPIDFKNKCNVGYAFINMVSPSHIISFYEAFNGKRWEKFNSEKVATLAYARIQGKVALITHFQNSSLMNEDKWCRPILFQSESQGNNVQESIPYHNMNICIRQPDGSYSVDSLPSSSSSLDEHQT